MDIGGFNFSAFGGGSRDTEDGQRGFPGENDGQQGFPGADFPTESIAQPDANQYLGNQGPGYPSGGPGGANMQRGAPQFGGGPPQYGPGPSQFGGGPPPNMGAPQFGSPPPPNMGGPQYGGAPPPNMGGPQFGSPPPPSMGQQSYGSPQPPPSMGQQPYGSPQPPASQANPYGDSGRNYVGEFEYSSLFDAQGRPKKRVRNDDILGPVVMFVDTDLSTAMWRGSVMLIAPASMGAPQVMFFDAEAGQPLAGVATQLLAVKQSVFWRFDVALRLGISSDKTIEYRVNGQEPAYRFTIPGQQTPWRWCFWSCNGWSLNVTQKEKEALGGTDVVWDDLLAKHAAAPFHVMFGGGDQLYSDVLWEQPILKPWLKIASKKQRQVAAFTVEMAAAVDEFYFVHYVRNWFYTCRFTDALTTVPFSFIIDDHDIFDGWGSYPDFLHLSTVFQGIKHLAFKYYLLFQAQTTHERSRQFGYWGHAGYSWLKQLGPFTAALGFDTRFERSLKHVISPETYDEAFARLQRLPPSVRHLQVFLGVPIVYPRLTYVESAMNLLGKFKVSTLNAFQKDGAFVNISNAFGEPELLDDLNDHWTANIHLDERKRLVQRLQDFARTRSVRVTFVAGDVHCCGAGCFLSAKPALPAAQDFRLMPQIVSSAIVNVPPPNAVIRMVHLSSKTYTLDQNTHELMYELFHKDVNGKKPPNNNHKLLARRNFSSYTEDLASGNIAANIHVQRAENKGTVAYPIVIQKLETKAANFV